MARFLITADSGESCEVDCKLEESGAFKYGNGTQAIINGELVRRCNWCKPMVFDTRYINFNECGGFDSFCEAQLEALGFTVIRL